MPPECTALWDSIWRFISSESLPAWLQAGGSLLALYVAFRVSRSSIEHARGRSHLERDSTIQNFQGIRTIDPVLSRDSSST